MNRPDVPVVGTAAAGTGHGQRGSDHDDRLGELEWEIVEIARVDGPHGSNPDSLGTLLLRKLFGIATARPLANERLEGLRRFAVKAWFRSCIRMRDLKAFFNAGFLSSGAWRVLAHVAARRGRMPEVAAWPA
ncbi:MAG TPA: hypothetical protein VNR68_09735 [Sphingomicrobium sp.]|nr:hypothetical protein [Sphingomicrobium sp.]